MESPTEKRSRFIGVKTTPSKARAWKLAALAKDITMSDAVRTAMDRWVDEVAASGRGRQ